MSEDTREAILVRIEAILTDVAGDSGIRVYRDRAGFEDEDLPAYVLLDGIETLVEKADDRRGPQIMSLLSQIFYVPVPTENQLNVGIGPLLSQHRIKLVKGIMQDGPLQDLLGSNGFVEYRGMETDMQTGAEVKGQFRMDFAFAYVFNFNKL
jgi:hypothetical protein